MFEAEMRKRRLPVSKYSHGGLKMAGIMRHYIVLDF